MYYSDKIYSFRLYTHTYILIIIVQIGHHFVLPMCRCKCPNCDGPIRVLTYSKVSSDYF